MTWSVRLPTTPGILEAAKVDPPQNRADRGAGGYV